MYNQRQSRVDNKKYNISNTFLVDLFLCTISMSINEKCIFLLKEVKKY